MSFVTIKWMKQKFDPRLEATEEALDEARAFVFEKWCERAQRLGRPTPYDLSSSCRFSSLFVRFVFGGTLKGNLRHMFNEIDGQIIDLNKNALDVRNMEQNQMQPYCHVESDILHPDYRERVETCVLFVKQWSDEFIQKMEYKISQFCGP
jgi:hypothetical protein